MKNIAYIILITFFLYSCGNSNTNHEEGHNHEEEHEHVHSEESHEENEVSISSKQAANLNLQLGNFSNIKVSEVIEANGELELAPQNIADVHVLMGGVITKINVIEGTKVKKGQVLATMKHPDIIKLQEDLISKNSELSYIEKEYKRQEKLYSEKVGSGRDYQKVKSEYEGVKALVDALKAKIRMLGLNPEYIINGKISEYISIRSPLDGKVSLVETNMGEYVSTDKRLFQVVDNKHLHCAFRIYEKDILKVKEGQQIEVSSPSFRNQTFTATIYAISPAFEESPKSLHIHADFEKHDDRLISGMYVTGKIKSDSISRIVLPRNAVVVEDDKKYVFIKSIDEKHEDEHNHHGDKLKFLKMEVTTGIEQDDWIEILNASSFPENSKIVLKSAYYLQAEIGKGETEHSH